MSNVDSSPQEHEYEAKVLDVSKRAPRSNSPVRGRTWPGTTSILDEAETSHIARMTDTVVDVVMPLTKDEKPVFTGSYVAASPPAELAARAREMKPWEVKEALVSALGDLISPTAGKVLAFEAGQSVGRQFRRVLDDYRSGYVLEYVPSGVAPEGWHEITVTVTKRGKYDVRARNGYQNDR